MRTPSSSARGAARAAGGKIVNARPAPAPRPTPVVRPVIPPVAPVGRRQAAANVIAQTAARPRGFQGGVNPFAAFIQKNIITNLDPLNPDITPEQLGNHALAMALADTTVSDDAKVGTDPVQKIGRIRSRAIARLTKSGMTPENAAITFDAQAPNIQQTMSNTGLGGSFDQAGAFVPPPISTGPSESDRATAAQLQQDIINSDPSKVQRDPSLSIETYQAAVAAAAAAQTEKMQQLALLRDKMGKQQLNTAAGGVAPPAATPPATPKGAPPPPATVVPPAAPLPNAADPASGTFQNIKKTAEKLKAEQFAIAAEDPIDYEQQKEDEGKALAAKYAAIDAETKIAKDQAYETERASLQANSRAQELANIENTKSQLDQMKLNTENEIKVRRRINKLGGGDDISGLNFIQKEVQNGLDSLNYLRSKAANLQGEFGDKAINIINRYGFDLKKADSDKKTSFANSYDAYLKDLRDITQDQRLDSTDRRKAKSDAVRNLADEYIKLDYKHGDNLVQLRLKAMDNMTEIRKAKMTQTQNQISNAMRMLDLAAQKGIKLSPSVLAQFEQIIAPGQPPGWFTKIAGQGDGTDTRDMIEALTAWQRADPDRNDITTLSRDAKKLILNMWQARGTPLPPGVSGPQPATPTAFGKPKSPTESPEPSLVREWKILVEEDPSFAITMPLREYIRKNRYIQDFNFYTPSDIPVANFISEDPEENVGNVEGVVDLRLQ